jgi:hypothetical protein
MRHEDQIKQGITTTLDEPISDTIKRDLNQIKEKLIVVLLPLSHDSNDNVLNKLKDWDLWGPLLIFIVFSVLLSLNNKTKTENIFSIIFLLILFHIFPMITN